MEYFIFVFLTCFFLFLFCIYAFGNDDFVLFKKHITMEKIFNFSFLLAFVSLFFARFFYVVFHFAPGFLNPLVFFLFPYFPGLSFAGGLLGGVIFFLFYSQVAKLPLGRLFDFFSLSLLYIFPVGFILYVALAKNLSILALIGVVICLLLAIGLRTLLVRGIYKEGSVGVISLMVLTITTCLITYFYNTQDFVIFSFSAEFLLSLFLSFVFFLFLLYQERTSLIRFLLRK